MVAKFSFVSGGLVRARFTEPLAMVWITLAFAENWGNTGHAFKLLRK
jgi:hypothetical protein